MDACESADDGSSFGPSHALRRTLLALCGIFAIGWTLAVIGISRNMRLPVDERWAGSGMLFLEGVIALLWMTIAYSWQRAVRFALVVLPSAFLIELIGVTTGVPFGPYHYTNALAPSVVGRVPAPITCAWLMIALGTLATAAWIVQSEKRWVIVPVAAVLATALDACLEPTAFHVKAYWLWETSGRYYGVPAVNFLGWLLTAATITALAALVLGQRQRTTQPALAFVPIGLYWATVFMFAIIDGFRGYPVGAAIGAIICLTMLPPLLRLRHVRRTAWSDRGDLSTASRRVHASGPNSQE
jgi:putative membrane protein